MFPPRAAAQDIPYDRTIENFEEIELSVGDELAVFTHARVRQSGYFFSYDDEILRLTDEQDTEFSIPLRDIAYIRVSRDKGRKALNYGLYGAVIGLFAGIPAGAQIAKNRSGDDSTDDAFIYITSGLGGVVAGGLIGTGIGLALLPGDATYRIVQPDR